jgi:plasmid maintenance system antidote protein VapI
MPHPLHAKIEYALAQRGLLKRDLARALGVSPQTATDICKGRSAITLPHLRRLVAYFGLRADYWLDDARLAPAAADEAARAGDAQTTTDLLGSEIGKVKDPTAFCRRLLVFANERHDDFASRFPDLGDDERGAVGLPRRGTGHVGQVPSAIEVST